MVLTLKCSSQDLFFCYYSLKLRICNHMTVWIVKLNNGSEEKRKKMSFFDVFFFNNDLKILRTREVMHKKNTLYKIKMKKQTSLIGKSPKISNTKDNKVKKSTVYKKTRPKKIKNYNLRYSN